MSFANLHFTPALVNLSFFTTTSLQDTSVTGLSSYITFHCRPVIDVIIVEEARQDLALYFTDPLIGMNMTLPTNDIGAILSTQ